MKQLLLAVAMLCCIGANGQIIKFINNTNCTLWEDFYCSSSCTVAVNTGGLLIPGAMTTSYNATTLNGGIPLAPGHAWLYGRIGDDNSNCSLQPAGGGCGRNFYLTISNGVCVPGVTAGCFNADISAGCNTCGNSQIFVTTVYYTNGDLDVIIN